MDEPPRGAPLTSSVSEAERARRRRVLLLALLLLIGLPLYILTAALIVGALTAPTPGVDGAPPERALHWAVELLIYLGLGVVWAFPLKRLVVGVGRAPKD